MKDLKDVTVKEMNAMSVLPILDKNKKLILDPTNYWEEDGIRFFKKPLKINYVNWGIFTGDCASIMKYFGDSDIIYVFAYPIDKRFEKGLKSIFYHNQYEDAGYDLFPGFEGLEVNAIDNFM